MKKFQTTTVASAVAAAVAASLACAAALPAAHAATPAASPAAPSAAAGHDSAAAGAGIAWHMASSDADVDAAFAQARAERKPVFVYWGAKWCPPCNQVKATVFNRQDFIERSRAYVAVYVDGDSPGAQKLGTRFSVRGYPTMVLFNPAGDELTRLPGEVDAAQITQVLTLAMNAQRPARQVLAMALSSGPAGAGRPAAASAAGLSTAPLTASRGNPAAGGKPAGALTANDWRLLAFYSWDTDEQQLVPKAELPALLARLADACPPTLREPATRLRLKALAAAGAASKSSGGATSGGVPAVAAAGGRTAALAARTRVLQVLADPVQSRSHMDVLTNNASDIVIALAGPLPAPAAGVPAVAPVLSAPTGAVPAPAATPAGPAVPAAARAATAQAAATAERALLVAAFDNSLKRLQGDASLSRADRMTALLARVDLAKLAAAPTVAAPGGAALPASLAGVGQLPPTAAGPLSAPLAVARPATSPLAASSAAAPPAGLPALPPALLAEVRDAAARADREIRDPYERQAVVTTAAELLSRAGLPAESDNLLQANLSRSHSPYYLMADLAHNARQRGDSAAALRWSEQAFNAAEGPATRLQWGASYVAMLVDLAPADDARIERVARQVFAEAAKQPDAFFERSGRSLKRVATKLVAWNGGADARAAVLKRLQADVAATCARLPAGDAQRASCEALFTAAPAGKPA